MATRYGGLHPNLFGLGYSGEAKAFVDFAFKKWMEDNGEDGLPNEWSSISVLYPVCHAPLEPETSLDHLAGYAAFRPVRMESARRGSAHAWPGLVRESNMVNSRRAFLVATTLCAMSAPTRAQIEMGRGRIEVVFESNESRTAPPMVMAWIKTAASAVTNYFGCYPVSQVTIRVRSIEGDAIESGQTFGTREGGLIKIAVGHATTQAHFDRDWMMTHEMIHLGFPDMPERHHWIEEGIATYVEPIARARIGRMRPEQVWAELVRDLPQGLPEAGDRGLDFTPTWGRTYWGGALFCFLADVEIHRRTANSKGLDDALRGILEAGGSIAQAWDLERALKAGDRATGVPVLQELYAKMRATPSPVDLEELWRKLGVERRGRTVALTSDAPLASVRRAIIPER